MGERARVEGVERIAVVRANAVGDLLFTLPALDALQAAYPTASITLIGAAWQGPFFAGRPGPVARCLTPPPSPGVWWPSGAVEDRSAVEVFLHEQRDEGYDLAFQFHGGGRFSNPFTLGLGARVTAGLCDIDAPALDRWVRYRYWRHEVLRFLEVAALVGAPATTLDPSVVVTDADRAEADTVLGGDDRPLLVLHPGAMDPRRRWPPASFAAVGDALAAAGWRVVVTGDAGEAGLVPQVVAAARTPLEDMAGRLSLCGLAGVLERADVVVGNDTGPLHLAAAVGTDTVGVYWGPNLVKAGPMSAERHRAVASWRLTCPVCGQDATAVLERCPHDASLVSEVGIGEVLDQVDDMVGNG